MYLKALFLMISLSCLIGCAALGHLGSSTQILPSSYGVAVSIDDLKHSFEDYEAFYSGPVYNPSAILFRPTATAPTLKLASGWKEVPHRAKLKALIKKIETIDPKLWVLATPDAKESRSLLAYIYTPAYASLRKTQDPGTFFLRPVPEQFNSIYYEYKRRPFDQTPEW